MCECEKETAFAFLPYTTSTGREYGTHIEHPVAGFEPDICAECRGLEEEAHPRAAIWGQKGKVERYYWREIFKTQCELILTWASENGASFQNIMDFQKKYPEIAIELKKSAKIYWQKAHKRNPKYDMSERTEANFLSEIRVPIREVKARYKKIERNDQKIGKWVDEEGSLFSAEQIAKQHYESLGYEVRNCERKLISTLIGTFLFQVIQDPSDPRTRTVSRGSTRGWTSKKRDSPLISFLLPEDFGTNEYYKRRKKPFDDMIEELGSSDLGRLFEKLLEPSTLLRDYLWVNDDYAVELARCVLKVIPSEMALGFLNWAAKDFWNRQTGWPDFLAFKDKEYLFIEVKSPHDKLSQDQMNWFSWAVHEMSIPCEICRIIKCTSSDLS